MPTWIATSNRLPSGSWLWVGGLEFGVRDLGGWELGFGVWRFGGFKVKGLGFGVWNLGVEALRQRGFRLRGLRLRGFQATRI
jgi:hypothetical protein